MSLDVTLTGAHCHLHAMPHNGMQVKRLLPPQALSDILSEAPQLLDAAVLSATLSELARLFGCGEGEAGQAGAARMLAGNPAFAHMASSLQTQSRGERDASYLGDIYKA